MLFGVDSIFDKISKINRSLIYFGIKKINPQDFKKLLDLDLCEFGLLT